MWKAPLDVHGIHPRPRAVRIGREIEQRAPIEHPRYGYALLWVCDPLEPRRGGLNSPDVPVIGRHTASEIDESIVGRPHWKVAVHPCRRYINPAVPWRSRLPHEQRIAWCGRVVYESLAIAGPIELPGLPQVGPQRTAGGRRGKNIHVAGLRAIRSPCPDRNERRVRREAERTDPRIGHVAYVAMRQIAIGAAA